MLCNGAARASGSIPNYSVIIRSRNLRVIQGIEFGSSGPPEIFLEQIHSQYKCRPSPISNSTIQKW